MPLLTRRDIPVMADCPSCYNGFTLWHVMGQWLRIRKYFVVFYVQQVLGVFLVFPLLILAVATHSFNKCLSRINYILGNGNMNTYKTAPILQVKEWTL